MYFTSRWFAKCGFVRLVKGDEFIARCLAERPTQESSQPQAGSQQQQVRGVKIDCLRVVKFQR